MNDAARGATQAQTAAGWGSDSIAELLRALDIRFIALTPGASFRGLHDSLVNHLGNEHPEMLLCGAACAAYQDRVMRNLSCKKIQCNEIWAFVGMKEKNVPAAVKGTLGYGDVYTWTAIDADTKLIPCWHLGTRGAPSAKAFMSDLAQRVGGRVQLTTDALNTYLQAVDDAFGSDIDYAMLVKLYGPAHGNRQERKYSPGECCGAIKGTVCGDPNDADISTSYVERANLTMRMHMRRFTRLTNGFSKKLENHMHAVSLHFMFYNFCKIHKTLRVTPAMEAKIDDHVWTMEEVVMMADTNY